MDIDAELLALAGGDESSGEEASPRPQDKSPSPEPYHRRRSSTPPAMGQKGTARKVKKPARRVSRKHDSDDDQISAESSDRDSLRSAPMSESDSEGGSPGPVEDGAIFPYEKYYHSAADKDEIMALPEIQREEIIADRAAQVERHLQDMALRRLLASREREEARAAEKKKRKAGAADLEETQRKSTRQRMTIGGRRAGEASSAIEAYKRQREEKGLRDEQRRREAAARAKERAERGASPQDDYEDADADGDSELEWDDPRSRRRSPTPPKDDPVAELVDIQRARIGRDNFAQVCFYPGFEKTITNCYTRICIGPGPNGQNAYRLAKILGLSKGRPYALQGPNGRMFVTDQWVTAAHGKAERVWPFLECSNSPFTEEEWRRYRVVLANENINLPTKTAVNKKLADINKLINHHFTEAEITEKMRRQNGLLDMVNRTAERKEIEERRRQARAQGDFEAVQACEDELKALVPMKLACNTSLNPHRTDPLATNSPNKKKEQDLLAEINRRNQQINAENIRKAQLAESRVKKSRATPANSSQGTVPTPFDNKTSLKVPALAVDDDLFGSDISRTATPLANRSANGTPTPRVGTPDLASVPVIKTATTQANGDTKKKSGGFGLLRKKKQEEDVLANLDLGIEIEI